MDAGRNASPAMCPTKKKKKKKNARKRKLNNIAQSTTNVHKLFYHLKTKKILQNLILKTPHFPLDSPSFLPHKYAKHFSLFSLLKAGIYIFFLFC
ncbi:hypothetical protein GJAV_G00069150 [Gymnothorax javanicus]|nr:hypothetical protein GJAV_G00069150 [Gymnothorax javanicus]